MPSLIIIDNYVSDDLVTANAGAIINLSNVVNVLGRSSFLANGVGSIIDLRRFIGPYHVTEEDGGAVILPSTRPAIAQEPSRLSLISGAQAVFTVSASGTAPLSYQWQFNGANLANGGRIAGATTNLLTLTSAQTTDAGSYRVIVSNNSGSVTSQVAVLTVTAGAPSITEPPTPQVVVAGTNVFLKVTATGSEPLIYQWYKDGVPIPNGTNSILALNGVTIADRGQYSVRVSNTYGSAVSEPVQLAIQAAPAELGCLMYAGITIRGTVGATYSVQCTTQVSEPINWQPLANVTLTQAEMIWFDTDSPNHPDRYYRAVVVE
jgi:hypothetical protein